MRQRLLPAAVIAATLPVLPLHAVAASPLALEEIIVTANKRETSLMETAASISAFDSDTRALLGIEGSSDLVARTPSLTITTFRVSIRGVGRPNLAVGSEPGIGVYWDDVYNTENGVFNYSRYLDIDRIEVLRGPQGTLYGRNSIGGAVKFISKRPAAEWGGTVVTELANYDGRVIQGLVSGPATDKLGVLAAASHIERGGFQDNLFNGKEYDNTDVNYATLSFEYRPTDRWNTVLKLIGVDRKENNSAGYILEPFNRELIQPINDVDTGEQLNFPGMFPSQNFVNMRQDLAITNPTLDDRSKVKVDRDPEIDNQRFAVFLTSEYEADNYKLKYTGSYNRYWFDQAQDADHSVSADSGVDWRNLLFFGTPVSVLTGKTVTPADMLYGVNQTAQFDSHELQYISDYDGRLNVIAGLYYYHSDEDQVVSFREFNDDLIEVYAFFADVLNAPVSDDNYLYRGEAKVDTRSYAAYGQLSWDWRDDTVLTFGLRYSYDDKEGTDNTFVQYVGDPDNPTVFREEADDWDEITWRLGVDHTLSDDHFLYAFVATGYRSGGFNFQKPSASPEVDQVEPEKLTSWEIGYKGSLWNNRANVGVSAYYYDYEDLQVLKRDVVNGIGLNTFVNAEEAVAMGIEFDWQLLLNQHWLFSGTWSFNDTEYEDFFSKDANACTIGPLAQGRGQDPLCQQDLNLKGNEFPLTPDHSVSLNATYMWDMFDLNWRATTSFLYRGDSWADAFNNPELDKIDDWSQWDARVTAATPDGDWEVQAFVRNISDSRAEIGIGRPSTVTQNATTTLSDPRLYGVRLTYNF